MGPSEGNRNRPVGLLLIGHGTRDPLGLKQFLETARQIAALKPDWTTQPCFLELASPTIAQGYRALAAAGVREVRAMPLVLLSAGHAKRDVPAAVVGAAAEHPGVAWRLTSHLGCHPRIVALSRQRADEAARAAGPFARHPSDAAATKSNWLDGCPGHATKSLLLLVARGSTDEDAAAEMHQFALARADENAEEQIRVCFYALTRPTLGDAIRQAADEGWSRVIVQPHLLFEGAILERIRRAVANWRAAAPWASIQLARPLGPDIALARAVLEIAERDCS